MKVVIKILFSNDFANNKFLYPVRIKKNISYSSPLLLLVFALLINVAAIAQNTADSISKDSVLMKQIEAQMQNKDLIQMDGVQIEALDLKTLKTKHMEDLKRLMPKNKSPS